MFSCGLLNTCLLQVEKNSGSNGTYIYIYIFFFFCEEAHRFSFECVVHCVRFKCVSFLSYVRNSFCTLFVYKDGQWPQRLQHQCKNILLTIKIVCLSDLN
jgi:hypothetical protein